MQRRAQNSRNSDAAAQSPPGAEAVQNNEARDTPKLAPRSEVTSKAGRRDPGTGRIVEMTSTEAQNNFGRVLHDVARDQTVVIKKRGAAQAVVISVERYHALTRTESPVLNSLEAEFDAMLTRMQTPGARAAVDALFAATGSDLGQAAVAAAAEKR
jgi:prevent-host-death family protein